MILLKIINLLNKTHDLIKDEKSANKDWKGIIPEEKRKNRFELLKHSQ